MDLENWKDIPNFEGYYQASDQGRIRSLDRKDDKGRLRKGRVLRPNPQHHGYLQVTLCGPWGRTSRFVHNLVCLAFYGESRGLEVDHLDEDKNNNCVFNLEYVTRHENVKRHHSKNRELYISYYPQKYPKNPFCVIVKNKHIGTFKTKAEAICARDEAIAL
jgi:hypothetical protein